MRAYYFFPILLGFLYLTPATNAYGEPTADKPLCVANAAEYIANKDQMPKALAGLDTSFRGIMYKIVGLKGMFASAAVKLRIASNKKFTFDVGVAKPDLTMYEEEIYISKFCYDGSKITFILENKQKYEATITGDKSYDMEGGSFEVTTPAEYAAEIEKVKAKMQPTADANSAAAPAKAPAASGRGKK